MTDDAEGTTPKKKKKAAKTEPIRGIMLGSTALSVLGPTAASSPVQISKGFRATVNGLVLEGQPSYDQALVAGTALRVFERSAPFALGDFVLYVEDKFGAAASQILDAENGWSLKTIAAYSWLAKKVPLARRRMDRLGVRHHMLVAVLTAKQQEYWLTKAAADDEEEPWTVKRLKDAIEDGGDVLPTAWWVLVEAKNEDDQRALMETLEKQGRSVKATSRRGKKKD